MMAASEPPAAAPLESAGQHQHQHQHQHSGKPHKKHHQPQDRSQIPGFVDAMLDLEVRFLLCLPAAELETPERMFFQIEQAHWFYEDFIVDGDATGQLPSLSLRSFAMNLFTHAPLLQPMKHMHAELYDVFREYVARALLLLLLVLRPRAAAATTTTTTHLPRTHSPRLYAGTRARSRWPGAFC
jgi:hypothetical protein